MQQPEAVQATARQLPAAGVHRKAATGADVPLCDEVLCLAMAAEAHGFEPQGHEDAETGRPPLDVFTIYGQNYSDLRSHAPPIGDGVGPVL